MPTERYSVVSSILLVAQAARFSALPESVRSKRRSQRVYFSMQQSVYNADLSVAERLYGRLNVTTPEIYVHGMLDGWLYLVMSRISGVYLSDIWDTLDDESRLRIIIELAEVVAQLHAVPADNMPLLGNNWLQTVARRIETCVQRHREQVVPDYWLEQISGYLAYAAPLYPPDFSPAIVSGDIHQYHLLVSQENRRCRLKGLFDFDDALIGFKEYDLAAAGLFVMAGNPALLRAFLLAYTLLHRYRPFNWVREDFAKGECRTLEEAARSIYVI